MENLDVDQNRHKYYKILGVIILVLAAVFVAFFVFKFLINKNTIKQETTKLQTISGWKKYSYDTLGFSFDYPPEWNTTNYPSNEITDLKTLITSGCDDTYDTDSRCHTINISFNKNFEPGSSNNTVPIIKIFDNQYEGEKYPNSYATNYGSINNIPVLRQTKNICNYKIDFNTPYQNTMREIYNNCNEGIKTAVVESVENFGGTIGTLYTYTLRYFSYKNLRNGIFDNLLISYTLNTSTITLQLKSPITPEEFFSKIGLDPISNSKFTQFKNFANSFNIYTPPQKQVTIFSVPAGEDENITLIRKYYNLLFTNQPAEAYKLIDNQISVEEFVSNNQNKIYKAEPYEFKKISENQYEFWLNYQENNNKPETQRLIVTIQNGKIKQDLVETLTSPVVKFGDKIAYASSRKDESLVILKDGEKELFAASAPNNFDKTLQSLIFRNVEFSPSGRYLLYTAYGWEWAYSDVYDTKEKKRVLREGSGNSGFSTDETLYFYCVNNEFSGEFAAVLYELPSFKVKLDILKQFPELGEFGTSISCEQNKENGLIEFKFKGKYREDRSYDENFSKSVKIDPKTVKILNDE
jgi:hypothetical protein